MWKQTSSRALLVPFLGLLVLCSMLLQSSPGLAVSSTPSGKKERSLPPAVIVLRARQWVKAQVPYSGDVNSAYRFQNYRADCSGLVTMAWGIPATPPNYGLSTGTNPNNPDEPNSLSSVADELGKAIDSNGNPILATMMKLQAGDILLNKETDAHVILFVGWIDVAAKQVVNHPVLNNDGNYYYDGIEENGSAGKDGRGQAIEHTPDRPLNSAPFDYSQPWPYPYYPGHNSAGYYAWRYDATKAAKLNLSPAPSIKPGGLWITPKNGDTVTDVLHLAVHAYPTHQGDPAISLVYFTINSNGSWMVACTVSPPATGNMFACDVNLKDLGIFYGQIQVSFDVYDQAGNNNLAPNGVHSLTYAPTPQPVPTPTPPPTPTTIYIGLLSYDQLLPFYPVDYDSSTAGGTIFALNINNGSNRWYHTFDGNINSVAVSDGIAYMSENGNIYMFNISDGTLVRHFKVGDFIDPPVVVNGVIYIHAINRTGTSSESVFYALNNDGSQIWSYPTGPVGNRSSGETPVVDNKVLYASTEDGRVYALNTTNGSLLWHTQLDASDGSANLSSPTVLNGIVYVAGYSSGHLYALNANTGSLVWRSQYNSGGGIASLTASGGVLYISNDVSIYALRASDGNQLWHKQTDGHRNLLTAVGGVVYVSSSFPTNPNSDGSVTYAFRASDGFMLWRTQTQAQAHQASRVPEVVNGIVYVASDYRTGHNIDALHASDGTVIWESSIF